MVEADLNCRKESFKLASIRSAMVYFVSQIVAFACGKAASASRALVLA